MTELTGVQVPENFGRRGRPRGSAIAIAQRNQAQFERIVEMLAEGKTQEEIGKELAVSQQRVSQLYRTALEFVPMPTIQQRRELQLLRLDQAIERTLDVLEGDHPYVSEGRVVFPVVGWDDGKPIYGDKPLQDAKPLLDAARTLFAGLKREAETIGSDAPKRSEVIAAHVNAEDLRVTKIISSLGLENDEKAAAIRERATQRRQLAPGAQMVVDAAQDEEEDPYDGEEEDPLE